MSDPSRDAVGHAAWVPVKHTDRQPGRLGAEFTTLVRTADNMQIYKYVVHNVARPIQQDGDLHAKPIKGDNGSGMHVHQSVWRGADLRRQSLCRFVDTALPSAASSVTPRRSTPSPTDHERLQAADPRLRAPVLFASSRNRSAACRIVHREPQGNASRFLPRPAANPYLAFAAMLMAGIDGIRTGSTQGTRSTRTSTTCRRVDRSRWSAARYARPGRAACRDPFLLKGMSST